jgi:ectoine hydroxylase-related dioxygenase (phytanoyl-CoA dioxygenase family)
MLTIRLHLDDALEANGALRVLPGSHRCGRMSDEGIEKWARSEEAVTCEVRKGGVLAMRPLLLHSSLPSQQHQPGEHRRIIHLEFASGNLPNGLEWACS